MISQILSLLGRAIREPAVHTTAALASLPAADAGLKAVGISTDLDPTTLARGLFEPTLWITLGIVLGGRIGFVLFYEPSYFWANPAEIPAVWNGGMSFHGGLLGVALAVYLFARIEHINALSLGDIASAATPFGLFFGRIANFINSEVVGRVSDVPWAMVFPGAGDAPRHPSQLYEATLEGVVLFIILRIATHRYHALERPGTVFGLFLVFYGLFRSMVEFVREPHAGHPMDVGIFTPGIVYSLPMIAVGLWLIWRARRVAALAS